MCAPLFAPVPLFAAPVELVEQAPVSVIQIGERAWLVDFGKVAFGNLALMVPESCAQEAIVMHFGEAVTAEGRVNREPPGTVRYARVEVAAGVRGRVVVEPLPDARNTAGERGDEAATTLRQKEGPVTPPAVLTPPEWGVILPFRWVEIEGLSGPLCAGDFVRRAAFDATWDDSAAQFACSDALLNRIWELCHYSIKATTYAGVFVDGDRERIPYEADAYLNQLSYYACNADPRMARDTFDHLVKHPTWPTEWTPHMVFIAHADWMHTGDRVRLAAIWDVLKTKLQFDRAGPDGLLTSTRAQIEHGDIVDWPAGERDGFVFTSVNTVVNAFHLRALALMAELARTLGREEEAEAYAARFEQVHEAFLDAFFDVTRGLFRDGVGTDHASLHANLFPLAFGLAPADSSRAIADWLLSRGMRCSPYAAQYLMEAAFLYGDPDASLALMVAEGDRSWRYMVESGTTITWEAWAQHYKPNQDWNHAWGAAPANLLPRFVLGVSVAEPGWARVWVRPFGGDSIAWAEGVVPTPHGGVGIRWENAPKKSGSLVNFSLTILLPEGMHAQIAVPASGDDREQVLVNGAQVVAERVGAFWQLSELVQGEVIVTTVAPSS